MSRCYCVSPSTQLTRLSKYVGFLLRAGNGLGERIERIEDSGRAGMVSNNKNTGWVFWNRRPEGTALPRGTWEREKNTIA